MTDLRDLGVLPGQYPEVQPPEPPPTQQQATHLESDHSVTSPISGSKHQSQGGRARAQALTPERRREIALTAAATRWGKEPNAPPLSSAQKAERRRAATGRRLLRQLAAAGIVPVDVENPFGEHVDIVLLSSRPESRRRTAVVRNHASGLWKLIRGGFVFTVSTQGEAWAAARALMTRRQRIRLANDKSLGPDGRGLWAEGQWSDKGIEGVTV